MAAGVMHGDVNLACMCFTLDPGSFLVAFTVGIWAGAIPVLLLRRWIAGRPTAAQPAQRCSSSSRPDTPATGIAGVSGRPTPPAVGWRTAPRWWWRGLRLHLMTWRDLAVFVAWLCCLVVLAFPAVARLDRRVRRDARQHRALALRWGGVRVPAAYRTAVDPLAQGYGGRADQVVGWLREPINRRDLRWHLLGTVVAGLIAAVPPFLVVWMLWGLHGEDESESADQLRAAQRSRLTALDLQAAELKRIERDLHDGPQGPDPRLAGPDRGGAAGDPPAGARHPAARARRPGPARCRGVRLRRQPRGGRPARRTGGPVPEVVQAGLYFAVNECLANAIKHADATRIEVVLRERGGGVEARVIDDGIGGAQLAPGGGLAGVRRRVTALAGELEVDSPAGGPTVVTLWLPRVD